jgi:hypothetical protein
MGFQRYIRLFYPPVQRNDPANHKLFEGSVMPDIGTGHSQPTQSTTVTALAVGTLSLGAIRLALTAFTIWTACSMMTSGETRPNRSVLQGLVLSGMWVFSPPIMLGLGLVSLIAGILLILAGMGLWGRRRSSRALTLILGTLAGMLAALYAAALVTVMTPDEVLMPFLVTGLLVHGIYCVSVFVVLLRKQYAAEFA